MRFVRRDQRILPTKSRVMHSITQLSVSHPLLPPTLTAKVILSVPPVHPSVKMYVKSGNTDKEVMYYAGGVLTLQHFHYTMSSKSVGQVQKKCNLTLK